MAIFKRKEKQGSTESFKLVSDFNSPHVPFGSNISKSDVVKTAIDRIASQCAKLKPRYIKTLDEKDDVNYLTQSIEIDAISWTHIKIKELFEVKTIVPEIIKKHLDL